jgi:predicted nucleic acid-binding protein
VAFPEAVKREALYLAPALPDEPRVPVDIEAVISELKLEIIAPATDAEVECYVDLATELDDGEAMGLALAKVRGLVLLTDERSARKKATSLGVEVLTTPDVVRAWSDGVDERQVAEVIHRIGKAARYVPSPKDEHHEWWVKLAKSGTPNGK